MAPASASLVWIAWACRLRRILAGLEVPMEWVPVPESLLAIAIKYQVFMYAAVVGFGLAIWDRRRRRR